MPTQQPDEHQGDGAGRQPETAEAGRTVILRNLSGITTEGQAINIMKTTADGRERRRQRTLAFFAVGLT
ncbi:hypothetical protein [Pectobacterium aroidearum]|uniref:hypothetical protein n=1 Tax=Pectobacterium aroidearum TaxID=1201031 RepID=UPI00301ADA86